jgi:hypothetical protein
MEVSTIKTNKTGQFFSEISMKHRNFASQFALPSGMVILINYWCKISLLEPIPTRFALDIFFFLSFSSSEQTITTL